MITKDNLQKYLKKMGFVEKDALFRSSQTGIVINIKHEEIYYPKLVKVNDKTTSNFSKNENFVVLDCMIRLIKKGYKHESLELEPKWQVGHGMSGGKADIMIKDRQGKPLCLIECKTPGKEFINEWKKVQNGTSQQWTYINQDRSIKWMVTYTSDENGYETKLVSVCDDDMILKSLKNPLTYRDANNHDESYQAWCKTYKQDSKDNGLLEENAGIYSKIGSTNLTINDLKEITDIQAQYNNFATILRMHNISSRENAFDKLVNLFLCKLVDETNNPQNLMFGWNGYASDTYYDLVDRLQILYKTGMEKYLNEEISNVEMEEIDKAFKFLKSESDLAKSMISESFKKLKYYTNNDFAFLDVHNEKLFMQNSEILLKMVRMWQEFKLKSNDSNQFLGDLFEGFLDQGIKQSEGQFFTPIPIVRFIVRSLPLQKMVEENKEPLKCIDFACGSGHFLNEYGLTIGKMVDQKKRNQYIKNIYGIEKEYRLSKVSKVSSFMHGLEDINIKYGDALKQYDDIKANSFDILIANPPYSVKGFLQTLDKFDRNQFSLIHTINSKNLSTCDDIETFFIERMDQLLKDNAVVGIILPTSILTTSEGPFSKTREIILSKYDIYGIVKFSNGTFAKTGVTPITLFLKKRQKPYIWEHLKNRVKTWFEGKFDLDDNYQDSYIVKNYCELRKINFDEYIKFLKNQECELILDRDTEMKKLYTFALAINNEPNVILVKAPEDKKELVSFLGYSWSNRRGQEGIKYENNSMTNIKSRRDALASRKKLENIETDLYNPKEFDDKNKIDFLIRSNFLGNDVSVPEKLRKYVKICKLVDLLDFRTDNFDKININEKVKEIESEYPTFSIKELSEKKYIKFHSKTIYNKNFVEKQADNNLKRNYLTIFASDTSPNGYRIDKEKVNTKYVYKGKNIFLNDGGTAVIKYFDGESSCTDHVISLQANDNELLTKYLYIILKLLETEIQKLYIGGAGLENITVERLKQSITIPLPPVDVQQQVVDEFEKIESSFNLTKMGISEANTEIDNLFSQKNLQKNGAEKIKLIDLLSKPIEVGGDKPYPFSYQKTQELNVPIYGNGTENDGLIGYTNKAKIKTECISISARGTIGYPVIHKEPFVPIVRLLVLTPDKNKIETEFLYRVLKNADFRFSGAVQQQLTKPDLESLEISVVLEKDNQRKILDLAQKQFDKIKKLEIKAKEYIDNLRDIIVNKNIIKN